MIVFSFVSVGDYYGYLIPKTQHVEDIMDAVIQLGHSWELIVAFVGKSFTHLSMCCTTTIFVKIQLNYTFINMLKT